MVHLLRSLPEAIESPEGAATFIECLAPFEVRSAALNRERISWNIDVPKFAGHCRVLPHERLIQGAAIVQGRFILDIGVSSSPFTCGLSHRPRIIYDRSQSAR